ncbi:hypothetical protein Hanom_Chr13g01234841 [Helianthus anomalus]
MRCSTIFSRGVVGFFCLKYTLIFFSRGAATHPGQRVGPPLHEGCNLCIRSSTK